MGKTYDNNLNTIDPRDQHRISRSLYRRAQSDALDHYNTIAIITRINLSGEDEWVPSVDFDGKPEDDQENPRGRPLTPTRVSQLTLAMKGAMYLLDKTLPSMGNTSIKQAQLDEEELINPSEAPAAALTSSDNVVDFNDVMRRVNHIVATSPSTDTQSKDQSKDTQSKDQSEEYDFM